MLQPDTKLALQIRSGGIELKIEQTFKLSYPLNSRFQQNSQCEQQMYFTRGGNFWHYVRLEGHFQEWNGDEQCGNKGSPNKSRIDPMGPLIGRKQLAETPIMMPMNEIGNFAH